ncbi:MAG: hypothetical protein FWC41_05060 [Firmicutes bacterium]|nr:hypothetical protein [Bacillota bacterium]
MKKQDLNLDFIESGRMSDNELNGIYGGAWSCKTYTNCHENGKNTCEIYKNCASATDDNLISCGTYNWVLGVDLEAK